MANDRKPFKANRYNPWRNRPAESAGSAGQTQEGPLPGSAPTPGSGPGGPGPEGLVPIEQHTTVTTRTPYNQDGERTTTPGASTDDRVDADDRSAPDAGGEPSGSHRIGIDDEPDQDDNRSPEDRTDDTERDDVGLGIMDGNTDDGDRDDRDGDLWDGDGNRGPVTFPVVREINVLPVDVQEQWRKLGADTKKAGKASKRPGFLTQLLIWLFTIALVVLAFLGWVRVMDWGMDEGRDRLGWLSGDLALQSTIYALLLALGVLLAPVVGILLGRSLIAARERAKDRKRKEAHDRVRAWWSRADSAVDTAGVGRLSLIESSQGVEAELLRYGDANSRERVNAEEKRGAVWLVNDKGENIATDQGRM